VVSNRPDQHGTDDRTKFLGSRAITMNITAYQGGTTAMDSIPDLFSFFMDPGMRPELHVIEDEPSAEEMVVIVRAQAYTGPLGYPSRIDMQLGFIAPDPILYGAIIHTATAWAGATVQGRVYPRSYPWLYPPGAESPVSATIFSAGDLAVQPLLKVYGPATAAQVTFDSLAYVVPFTGAAAIQAGDFVTVDTRAKTAVRNSDGANVLNWIDWSKVIWPVLSPNVNHTMSMTANSPTGVTQVQAIWQDAFLA
jgi:hypothetical protein